MGGRSSTPERELEDTSPRELFYKQLYGELTAPDDTGAPANDKMFRNRFENYFGGSYLELGHLLYKSFFGAQLSVEEGRFVVAMTALEKLSWKQGEHHEAEEFYFTVFSDGKDVIKREGLVKILHVAATFSLEVGSELHENAVLPKDHLLLASLANSAMLHADKSSGELHKSQFAHWVSLHCPRLLEGVRQWTLSLLQHHTHSELLPSDAATASFSPQQPPPRLATSMSYQLPKPCLSGSEEDPGKVLETYTLVWSLSTLLPLVYLGHKKDEKKTKSYPIGGSWTLLYSSGTHGFSMNRFQHHCSDYHEPSVMLLSCYNASEEQTYMFAIAVDMEWRDGSYYWGGENFCLVQLQPQFSLLRTGPKLISLNEKQRGFPVGLRVMTSDRYDDCLLEVEPSLEVARLRDGDKMSVRRVDVWGCGGVEAAESQRRVKEWENREILRRRKVKKGDLLETWSDSPDRYLLELGGVTTKRPTEQQQE